MQKHSKCWLAPSPGVNCVCSLEINWCGMGKLFTVGLPRNQTPPFVLTPFQLTRIMDGWKDTEDEITATSPPCMPGKDLTHHYLPPLPPLHLFSPLRLHPPFSVCSCCLPEQERWMEDPDVCKALFLYTHSKWKTFHTAFIFKMFYLTWIGVNLFFCKGTIW